MIKQIKHIKKKIIALLREKDEYRDDDNKLIARVWFDQTGNDENGKSIAKQTTAHDFLLAFRDGQYINPESIRRCRQKVQEQNPFLRGKSYKERSKKGDEFKQSIHSV